MSTLLKDYVIAKEFKWCIYNSMCMVKTSNGEDENLEC
jgi:hypothetical protein